MSARALTAIVALGSLLLPDAEEILNFSDAVAVLQIIEDFLMLQSHYRTLLLNVFQDILVVLLLML